MTSELRMRCLMSENCKDSASKRRKIMGERVGGGRRENICIIRREERGPLRTRGSAAEIIIIIIITMIVIIQRGRKKRRTGMKAERRGLIYRIYNRPCCEFITLNKHNETRAACTFCKTLRII